MADEREDAPEPDDKVANRDHIQTGGRESNAAQPLNAAEDHGGPERYPSTDRTDSVGGERRSFDPAADAPKARQGAGDGACPARAPTVSPGPAAIPPKASGSGGASSGGPSSLWSAPVIRRAGVGEGIEVWRGSVATWECDAMGHLNVGFYAVKCMEALVGLTAELGMPQAFNPHAGSTVMVRELHVRFLKEARADAPLYIEAGVLGIGEEDASLLLLMKHASGELAASFHIRLVHATAREGRTFPWPQRVRQRAAALAIEVPPKAAPRSLALGSLESAASGARAELLGVQRIAMGVIGPAECDAFGRMRTEIFMGRVSSGIPHLFEGERPGATPTGRRVGGVALEYRMLHFDWPRVGDRFELRSGTIGGDARVRRLVHWFLDPNTGKAWGAAEAVAASFDLDARRILTLSDEEVAAWNGRAVAGLTI